MGVHSPAFAYLCINEKQTLRYVSLKLRNSLFSLFLPQFSPSRCPRLEETACPLNVLNIMSNVWTSRILPHAMDYYYSGFRAEFSEQFGELGSMW